MERAFISARPRNRHARRVFKLAGLAIIFGVLVAFSLISNYRNTGHFIADGVDDQVFTFDGIEEQKADSFDFSSFDSSKCDDGFPKEVNTTEMKCRFVTETCKSDRLIDYLHFRYCTLGNNTAAVIFGMALIFVWLLVLFYMLSQAAESHFCPMLSEISSALRMSPDLAGMSILAFGNGAPDVFSSIAAFQHDNVGVLIGEMLGAGAFITHVIVGAIGVSAHVKLRAYPFIRDLACYLLGLAFVLLLLIDGSLHIWEASMFLVFYFIYLGVAIVIHVVEVKRGKASVVTKGGKNKDESTASLLGNEYVVEAGEATLIAPDETPAEPTRGRRRALSVHITEVPVYEPPELATAIHPVPTAAGTTTTTTTTTTEFLTPGGDQHEHRHHSRDRARSVSPGARLNESEAASLRKVFEQIKQEEDEEAASAEEEVPELALPSTEFSVQANDQVKASPSKTTHKTDANKDAPKKKTSERRIHELKGLSEIRFIASSAAVVLLPRPGVELRRRYDDIEVLRERQRHLFRNGILNVVKDWKEGGTGDLQAPSSSTNTSDKPENTKSKVLEGDNDSADLMDRRPSLLQRFKDYVQWDEMGKFGRVVYILMLPISILMHITVPHPEDESYNKWLLAFSTSLSPLIIFWALDLYEGKYMWIAILASLVLFIGLGIVIALFASPNGLPRWLQFVFIFWGFVTSMMWIYYTADEIVSLLQSLSEIFSLSPTIMGLTLLAWGNCIGDFVADMTVSNQGYPEMGIAATYGGPLFNLLIGMGLGGSLAAVEDNKVPTPLNDMMLIDFIYLLSALTISLIVIPVRRFVVDKYIGAMLLVGYIVFMTLSILVETDIIRLLPHHHHSSSE